MKDSQVQSMDDDPLDATADTAEDTTVEDTTDNNGPFHYIDDGYQKDGVYLSLSRGYCECCKYLCCVAAKEQECVTHKSEPDDPNSKSVYRVITTGEERYQRSTRNIYKFEYSQEDQEGGVYKNDAKLCIFCFNSPACRVKIMNGPDVKGYIHSDGRMYDYYSLCPRNKSICGCNNVLKLSDSFDTIKWDTAIPPDSIEKQRTRYSDMVHFPVYDFGNIEGDPDLFTPSQNFPLVTMNNIVVCTNESCTLLNTPCKECGKYRHYSGRCECKCESCQLELSFGICPFKRVGDISCYNLQKSIYYVFNHLIVSYNFKMREASSIDSNDDHDLREEQEIIEKCVEKVGNVVGREDKGKGSLIEDIEELEREGIEEEVQSSIPYSDRIEPMRYDEVAHADLSFLQKCKKMITFCYHILAVSILGTNIYERYYGKLEDNIQ
jgi:hypothetical protein